jgi:hypothetical protein
MKGIHEVLQQKEADLARVRKEVESLHIALLLLADELPDELPPDELGELPSDEPTRKPASAAREALDVSPGSEATGTDDLLPSMKPSPRPRLWEILRAKT